jgi:hypothetical protein
VLVVRMMQLLRLVRARRCWVFTFVEVSVVWCVYCEDLR